MKTDRNEFASRVRRVVRMTFLLLAVFVLGWGFTYAKSVFAGLILGTSVSLFNAVYTAYKIDKIRRLAESGMGRKATIGTAVRLATSALAALLAVRYPERFDMLATVIGLVSTQAIAFADGVYHLFLDKKDR
ncbi:ATP synthase subunit I [Bacillaceae bacterium]